MSPVAFLDFESALPATPLVSKHFAYPSGIPYQVDPDPDSQSVRGPQMGYNLCNATTEGPTSECQTLVMNNASDFCVWAPMMPDSTIADTEGVEVAWCSMAGRGTRLIPPGALQGVVGYIDQTLINMQTDDAGGELDFRGNPLGALVYSNAWSNDSDAFTQVIEWHNFMGGNQFCFKACDPTNPNASLYCNHVYDRMGCDYNAPNDAQNGTFESCQGDVQDFPGVYTVNGTAVTYTQPPKTLGPITTVPYEPRVPASSSCTTYASTDLFEALEAAMSTMSASSAIPGAVPTGGPVGYNSATLRFAGASASGMPSPTGTPSAARGLSVNVFFVLGAVLAVVAVGL
ncbi:hypothetical protein FB45DRAFT_977544 [Roridomyces roridus]|uniref:Macrofage activating glycoprotein n=1 Tax=Roridomyces roridus TaxID=1738132 RepID=A0AAD7C2L8_9AGAR|nr:hypothetical protein FB45DRAFT_977544 [Roridomyces roridus]